MSVHHSVENVYVRQEAVRLTRQHFWSLLTMALIFKFVTEALAWALVAIGDALMVSEIKTVIDQYAILVTSTQMTSSEPLLTALVDLLLSPKFIIFNLVYIVVTALVSAGLSFGRIQQFLSAARGDRPKPLRIFGGMKHCLKTWGVQLLCGLKLTLWMLPGIAVMLLGSYLTTCQQPDVGNLIIIIGIVLMLVLGARALLRYGMAVYLLADDPTRGVRECVKTSKAMLKGRLWQYFKVDMPVFFKMLGVSMLAGLLFTVLENVITMDAQTYTIVKTVLDFAATIYFVLQLHMVQTSFFLRLTNPTPLMRELRPISEWLSEHTATDIEPETTAESDEDSPADMEPQTNEEKEISYEEPDR